MTCKVSCLVPRPDQLEPLILRIRAAGIDPRDIKVVPHEQWRLLPEERSERQAAPGSPFPWLDWWGIPFAQATLWWEWASGAIDGAPDGKEHLVISLAQYEAGRRNRRCRTPA